MSTKSKNAPKTASPKASKGRAKPSKAERAQAPAKVESTSAPVTPEKASPQGGKMSGLDAAAKVLAEKGAPMTCKDMVDTMLTKGYWSTAGKTPAATLYSAILREIDNKPGESRFTKTGRGLFDLVSKKA